MSGTLSSEDADSSVLWDESRTGWTHGVRCNAVLGRYFAQRLGHWSRLPSNMFLGSRAWEMALQPCMGRWSEYTFITGLAGRNADFFHGASFMTGIAWRRGIWSERIREDAAAVENTMENERFELKTVAHTVEMAVSSSKMLQIAWKMVRTGNPKKNPQTKKEKKTNNFLPKENRTEKHVWWHKQHPWQRFYLSIFPKLVNIHQFSLLKYVWNKRTSC